MVDSMATHPVSPPDAGSVQDALDAALRGIAALTSVDDVLQVIVDRVRPLVAAEYAALAIVDEDGRIIRFITSGMDAATRTAIGPIPEGHGMFSLITRENRSYRVRDINRDPRRYGFPPRHPPMTSFLGVPITYGGETIGRLYLTNKSGSAEFSEDDQRLVETFALHAGIAMTNARLLDRSRLLAVAEERDRISKDLHDGIIQNLYAVALALEGVADGLEAEGHEAGPSVDRAIDAIHHAIGDIRNFIVGLRPQVFSEVGLVAGLTSIVDDVRPHTSIAISLEVPPGPDDADPEVTGHLLAITGEALSNVVRHSAATSARVVIERPANGDAWLVLRVEDDGQGFDPTVAARHGHQGLTNMRERAAAVGGSLSWEARQGGGTSVVVRIPGTEEERSRLS
jgi:signal transduction histidine kinase